VSMNVTFRECESYFSSGVSSPFGDSLDTGSVRREGESSGSDDFRIVSVGDISCSIESVVVESVESAMELVDGSTCCSDCEIYASCGVGCCAGSG
jgi:hypothetical protein